METATLDIPITPAQQWLFKYFSPPYEWYDCLSFGLTVSLSREEVEQILLQLILRHEGLRTTFFFDDTQWRQRIHPSVENIRDFLILSDEITDAQGLALCKTFDIKQLPLFKVVMIKKPSGHSKFVVFFHHIIVDYISVVVFFKEFCALANKSPLPDNYSTNKGYAERFLQTVARKTWEQERLFWEQQQVVGQASSGNPCLEKYACHMSKKLSKEKTDKLIRYGKKVFAASSLSEIVAAPLYKAFADLLKTDKVVISHKLHGRDIDASGSCFFSAIGNFAINVPVACTIPASEEWSDLIGQLKTAFDQMPMKGLSYDTLSPGLYPDHLLTNVRINYMGNFSFPVPSNVLVDFKTFARRVSHPGQHLTTFIEFFLYFCEGELIIETSFDPRAISENAMEGLMKKHLHYLDQLLSKISTRVKKE